MEKRDTIFCGNLSAKVTNKLLYELFLQAGPITSVNIVRDIEGESRGFGFVTFKHEASVPYAIQLFTGEKLFNLLIDVKPRIKTGANSSATSGPRAYYTPHRQRTTSPHRQRTTSPYRQRTVSPHRPQDSGGRRGGDSSRRNGSSSTSDRRDHSSQRDSRRRSVESRSSSSSYSRQASRHTSSHSSVPSTPHIPQNMYAMAYTSSQQSRHFRDSSPLVLAIDPLLDDRERVIRQHQHPNHRELHCQKPYYRDSRR